MMLGSSCKFFGRAKHGQKPPTSRQIVRTLTNQYFQGLRYAQEPFNQSLKWTFKTVPPKMVLEMALHLASVGLPFQINETRLRD